MGLHNHGGTWIFYAIVPVIFFGVAAALWRSLGEQLAYSARRGKRVMIDDAWAHRLPPEELNSMDSITRDLLKCAPYQVRPRTLLGRRPYSQGQRTFHLLL